MKKIGVLTFHRSLNYGAILQARGLVESVKKLGFESELIDYRNENLEKRDSFQRFYTYEGLVRNIFNIIEMPFWLIRRKKFDSFLNDTGVSPTIKTINDNTTKDYTKLIVGSDQVWNPKVTNYDTSYFFSDVSNHSKKVSYAASFGVSELDAKSEAVYKPYLSNIKNISVREETGVELVKGMIDLEPDLVIDPSMLLNKEEWRSIYKKQFPLPLIKEKYIVIYQRAYSNSLIAFAKKLSKSKNCKLVTITGNPRQLIKGKYVQGAGPLEWLNIVDNAEYVVTNSFHGVAFALNLNKNLFVEYLNPKFAVNTRLENIIKNFQIEHCLIDTEQSDESFESLFNRSIDYEKLNLSLEDYRTASNRFLESVINS
ncbi:polysaccharide pyruvyl transferase family protein [Exiguobacterium sp.]|uniref:polysaccharide pyruvyl transferase family protein n=1 Tax=Exiguobacterium sp. TaxID=44751 RepID=UPI00263B4BC1|nr:polysaccharide pyruvyl transferase family protein [Exiguobacterium sp.]MCC5893807.1 polysaccharide pyruvyl transferase family protein [Exiguobacterium sp.]